MNTLKTLSVSHRGRSLLTALDNVKQIRIGDMLLLVGQSNKTTVGNFELARRRVYDPVVAIVHPGHVVQNVCPCTSFVFDQPTDCGVMIS